jgi:predicted nucleic acid-binding protein
MALVIDATIVLAWSFDDERDAESVAAGRAILRERALVPALWRWEVQNVLRGAEKRGRITERDTSDILQKLRTLPVSVDLVSPALDFAGELHVARRFSLSVYDAAYLELAARRGLRLATKDAALRAAAAELDLLWQAPR